MVQSFPKGTKFRFPWRPYQKRILDELEIYLDDDRLHVVAAPGSGKTVLGLEVVTRINKPTLVLTPTLAIRDQWVERLEKMFLPDGQGEYDWISLDIRNPRFFTVSTYQGLHSALTGEEEEELSEELDDETEEAEEFEHPWIKQSKDESELQHQEDISELARMLKSIGIATVVVDEAHHLRSAWWISLTQVIEEIGNPKILALTATPPYDVSHFEWERYYELCGDIDAEVAVPELVMENNLCPHQDYIMFSTPSEGERDEIDAFRQRYRELVEKLGENNDFKNYISSHPWIQHSEGYVEAILEEPQIFSAMLIFLNHYDIEIPVETLHLMTDSPKNLPELDEEWIEILLQGIVFHKEKDTPKELEKIGKQIRSIGLVHRRRVRLERKKDLEKILKRSISKLQSIKDIINIEYESLATELKAVILTDYIRKPFMPRSKEEEVPLTKMGAVPIFEGLRRENIEDLKIGILSGSLIIIPKSSENILWSCLEECDIDQSSISLKQLPHTDDYYEVDIGGRDNHKKVDLITEFFSRGGVHVLIGTKALLGEGWDAPFINTLLLATFVGSYMLSNQMRGRAIRTQRGNPFKTANVWHLVCVETGKRNPGPDYQTMKRRFRAFLGPTFGAPVIQSGLDRIVLQNPPYSESDVYEINSDMIERAYDRARMRESWERALKIGEIDVKQVEEIKSPPERLPRSFVFKNTISALFWESVLLMGYYFSEVLRGLRGLDSVEVLLWGLAIIFLIAAIIFLPKFLKVLYLFIRNGPIKTSMQKVGEVVLKTLCEIGEIKTPYQDVRVVTEEGEYGIVLCHIEGGTSREKANYLRALQEVLDPIENPRYLLIRKSIWKTIDRKDYHAVPKEVGTRKEFAEKFAKYWNEKIGNARLVYTRHQEGRMILLRARTQSLSAAFVPKSQRISRWK
ncbi:MAG: hypothetical protein GF411_12695 [Candidatus Lokiarchaeota archaeon]|nr:hypothetical protein [Candidatus Lokiarchaeota archaeon]